MSVQYKWKIPNISLFNPKIAQSVMDKEIVKTLNIIVEDTRNNIISFTPVGATGRLANTIGTEVNASNKTGRVFTGVNYAPAINNGRKAAPVSFKANDSLIRWMRLSTKGRKYLNAIATRMANKTGKIPKSKDILKTALFLLRQSLKHKKREANPFFDKGIEKSRKIIMSELDNLSRKLAVGLMT